MKTSSALNRGLMLAVTLSALGLAGWMALRHHSEETPVRAALVAPQEPKENALEAQKKKEATAQWLAEAKKKLQQTEHSLEKLRRQRQELQSQLSKEKLRSGARPVGITPENSIEFSPVDRERSTWTGHTDPDRVWHDQRERARQTLRRFDLPPSASQR